MTLNTGHTTDLNTARKWGTGDTMDEWTAVADFGDTLDEVRANGLISVCLGCGSTMSVSVEWKCNGSIACCPDLDIHGRSCEDGPERARQDTRDAIDWDAVDCCPSATRCTY